MRVLLTSSGLTESLAAQASVAWQWPLENRRILHVNTASLVEENRMDWVQPQLDALTALGAAITDTDITAYTPAEISTLLDAHDIIYMQGGDTFFLRRHLQNSGAFGLINDAVRANKIAYIGTSAGTIIASADMILASYRITDAERKYQPGCPVDAFNFVPAYIGVHSRAGDEAAIKEQFGNLQPLHCLKDGEGWLVANGAGQKIF